MAAVTVTFDGTRVDDANALGTVWLDSGGGKAVLEADVVYQSGFSVSEKVGTVELGVKYYNAATAHDFTSPSRTAIFKVNASNYSALNPSGSTGGIIEIGSGNRTNYYRYYVLGNNNYPPIGGWQIIPIDPNVAAYRSNTILTPNLAAVDFYCWLATFTATAKTENLMMDAIDFIPNGYGISLVGGTSTDDDGTFTNFINIDEGTPTNRWGVVTSREGVLYVIGTLTIGNTGSAGATNFTDSNKAVVFPDGRFDTGFCGIRWGLQNSSTVISATNCSFTGKGTQKTNDTRPDYTVTASDGTLLWNGCTFNTFRNISLTSSCNIVGSTFINGLRIAQSGATVNNCNFSLSTTAVSQALLISDNPELISNCTFDFNSGSGHAIEIVNSGSYQFSANIFNNYGSDDSETAAIFNNSSGSVTINVVNEGNSPTVRNGTGATTSVINAVVFSLTGLEIGSEVRIYKTSDDTLLAGDESVASSTFSYPYNYTEDIPIYVIIFHMSFKDIRITSLSLTANDQAIPIQQQTDRVYNNP